MKKVLVVHATPIAYFPPAMNMVRSLKEDMSVKVQTISTKKCNNCYFHLLKALCFEISSIFKMLLWHPDVILYYESSSAFSPYLYKRYFNKNVKVYVHYHEYTTPEQYERIGMRITSFYHKLERKWLYSHSDWVSQTSEKRMSMFLVDNPMIPCSVTHSLPNYPPHSWHRKEKVHSEGPVKCVYVGSLSLDDMYIAEFCEWVNKQNGRVLFDIYCFNFSQSFATFIKKLDCPWIKHISEGVDYYSLPNTLDKYDIGLILYKPHDMNTIWNETNKFYEYLVCGLDVWYPKGMTLLHEMDKTPFAPKIKEMDFDNMDTFDGTVNIGKVDNSTYHWFADDVYADFKQMMNYI